MLNQKNSFAIITYCSHLGISGDIKPLTIGQWATYSQILMKNSLNPHETLEYTIDEYIQKLKISVEFATQLASLTQRKNTLGFEIRELNLRGIYITTRADSTYPNKIKKTLGIKSPPLFYYAGDISLLNNNLVGFVGSRTISKDDIDFTKKMIDTAASLNYGVVSGGAKGIDTEAITYALSKSLPVVSFTGDGLSKNLKNPTNISAVQNGQMLIISASKPSSGFTVGNAMNRNKYIYMSSLTTIVVKSDLEKGGTWAGAVESVKKEYSPVVGWNNESYLGNMKLINSYGVIPINSDWNFDLSTTKRVNEQQSLFDL